MKWKRWFQPAPSGCSVVGSVDLLDSFVVVVTYGRSGSTLIQSLLNSIDGWCIRGENDNGLCPIAQAWANLDGSKQLKRMRGTGERSLPDDPWAGAELIDPCSFGIDLANAFFRNVIQAPSGTRVAGFKELRWPLDPGQFASTLDFIRRFFPRARFVFNTRNHDEVSRSAWWARMDRDEVLSRLQRYEGVFSRYMGMNPGHCIRIHYNEYTADHGSLEKLFHFLEEPFDPVLVDSVMSRKLNHLK